jgi:hypothetical protein
MATPPDITVWPSKSTVLLAVPLERICAPPEMTAPLTVAPENTTCAAAEQGAAHDAAGIHVLYALASTKVPIAVPRGVTLGGLKIKDLIIEGRLRAWSSTPH